MNEQEKIGANSLCVNTHATILQGIITRMSTNCSLCKTLGATVVIALAVIAGNNRSPKFLIGAIFAILTFCISDAVCLSLEVGFRKIFKEFAEKLHSNTLTTSDIFAIAPPRDYLTVKSVFTTLRSWSILLYYPPLIVILFIIW